MRRRRLGDQHLVARIEEGAQRQVEPLETPTVIRISSSGS